VVKARVRDRRDPAERRAQILDEAIRFLGERGYHGFTIQELAGRCNITNGALLYYFRSKEGLLVAVLEEYARSEFVDLKTFALERMRREGTEGQLSFAAVVEFMHLIGVRTASQPEIERLCLVLQAEAMGDPTHPASAFFRDREKMVTEGFAMMLRPYRDDAVELARELLAMVEGLTLRWLQAEQAFDFVAAWDRAVRKLLA